MGFFSDLLKSVLDIQFENASNNELKNVSDEELEREYEKRRQKWAKSGYGGNGEKTPEMKKLDEEMNKREAVKQKNNPNLNKDKNFRWTDANRWDKD